MMGSLVKIMNLFKEPRVAKMLLSMHSSGYLKDIGWIASFKQKMPIDKHGNPLPWVTYGFIDFIANRLSDEMSVFEYGVGNSTFWYAKKVKKVVSVEHDKAWYQKMQPMVPNNATLYYQELKYNDRYACFPNHLNQKFDIVIVDGRDRVNCMKQAIDSIAQNGVIILDDSERESYREGVDFLLSKKFKRLDFWGISPGLFYKKCTTIFYKPDNCLGI